MKRFDITHSLSLSLYLLFFSVQFYFLSFITILLGYHPKLSSKLCSKVLFYQLIQFFQKKKKLIQYSIYPSCFLFDFHSFFFGNYTLIQQNFFLSNSIFCCFLIFFSLFLTSLIHKITVNKSWKFERNKVKTEWCKWK